jgi:hypothetical protein
MAPLTKKQSTLSALTCLWANLEPDSNDGGFGSLEEDSILLELEALTDPYSDEPDAWHPADAEGQAIKEGARVALHAYHDAMMTAQTAIQAIRQVFQTANEFKEQT